MARGWNNLAAGMRRPSSSSPAHAAVTRAASRGLPRQQADEMLSPIDPLGLGFCTESTKDAVEEDQDAPERAAYPGSVDPYLPSSKQPQSEEPSA